MDADFRYEAVWARGRAPDAGDDDEGDEGDPLYPEEYDNEDDGDYEDHRPRPHRSGDADSDNDTEEGSVTFEEFYEDAARASPQLREALRLLHEAGQLIAIDEYAAVHGGRSAE